MLSTRPAKQGRPMAPGLRHAASSAEISRYTASYIPPLKRPRASAHSFSAANNMDPDSRPASGTYLSVSIAAGFPSNGRDWRRVLRYPRRPQFPAVCGETAKASS